MMPTEKDNVLMYNAEYLILVDEIKSKIRNAQYRATLAANSELMTLYWNIGKTINEHSRWGNKFIDNLARDIKSEYPNALGYSVRNLKYMAKFAKTYPDFVIVQRTVAQLPWRHNIVLMDKISDASQRLWYLSQTIENNWTKDTLVLQIESGLYRRQAISVKTSNFSSRLPSPQSELAEQTLKDPYIFSFIDYRKGMIEREIESELVKNVAKLLLEFGNGFAFVGEQYPIEVENEDFYIDLLFYHLKLHCYVVVELKTGNFIPEYAGKLNFYISAVDDLLAMPQDNPTIGILLCKDKKKMIAEYALRNIDKPMSVAEYKLLDKLPDEYKNFLPSAEDIKNRMNLI